MAIFETMGQGCGRASASVCSGLLSQTDCKERFHDHLQVQHHSTNQPTNQSTNQPINLLAGAAVHYRSTVFARWRKCKPAPNTRFLRLPHSSSQM